MKLLTYRFENQESAGVLMNSGSHVLPLKAACLSKPFPSLLSFICEHKETDLDRLGELAKGTPPSDALPLEELEILAPIPSPKNDMYCLGLNYRDHVAEGVVGLNTAPKVPDHAVYFTKRAACVTGPGDKIPLHENLTKMVDYEVELAIVLKKGGRNIAAGDVKSCIFGYTVVNDVSARDLQAQHNQWFFGKNLDGYLPMGPYLVTADEFSYPIETNLMCRVNGELRQNSNTKNFIFPLEHVIPELSQGITLEPGDIIATGTPAGVGMGFHPPCYLADGDVVECEVEGIGVLRNPVGK